MNTGNHQDNPINAENPLLFISHKHCDHKVADVISSFVRNISGGGIDVYQSSSPNFDGPRAGKELTKELEDALWRAGIVLLIYTSQDQDWSWCMWECGVALEPNSPDTKVVVLQCLRDEPQIFKHSVHVHSWEEDSLIGFAKRFLDPEFFPNFGNPTTKLTERELESAARNLYKTLRDELPSRQRENWNAWPYMRIQIPRGALDCLNDIERQQRLSKAREILLEEALIICTDSGLPQIFKLNQVSFETPLKDLVHGWSEHYPNCPTYWLDVLVQQIVNGAFKQSPDVPEWHRFRHVKSNEESIPGVGRIKGDSNHLQFDVYFFGVANIPLATTIMNSLGHMYYVDLSRKPAHERNLLEILNELESKDWSRLPVLDEKIPKGVIHVSVIDRFVRKKALSETPIRDLTLADILADPEVDSLLEKSWVTIPRCSTLADARKAIRGSKKCQDVFVTETGGKDEIVLGWLTDHDINNAYH
jgi:hypothetical protein